MTLQVVVARVTAEPADRLNFNDRALLRRHAAHVRVLVERREDWSDRWSRWVPEFDPTRAFLTPEITAPTTMIEPVKTPTDNDHEEAVGMKARDVHRLDQVSHDYAV